MLRTEVQGNLSRILNHDLHRLETLSLVSVPYRERRWTDIEPAKFSQGCFQVSKFMIRLLRHDDTAHREDDGAVRFDDLAESFTSRFAGTSHWSIQAWISFLGKGRRTEEKVSVLLQPSFFQTCPVFSSNAGTFRRYSRSSYVARQCTVTERLRRLHLPHRERSQHALRHPGWIDSRRKKFQKGQAVIVFHSREHPMYTNQNQEEVQYDLTGRRQREKTMREKTRQDKMKEKTKEKKTEIMMWTDAESKFAQEKA